MAHSKKGGRLYSINPLTLYSINPINRHDMAYTTDPTREEIEALEREIQKKRNRRVRTAVNPERQYGC